MSVVLERLRAKQAQAAGAATTAAIDTTAHEPEPENELQFSPDQKPAPAASSPAAKPEAPTNAAPTTPPAGPPATTTKPADGPRLPPKKKVTAEGAQAGVIELHRKLPIDVVARVVMNAGSAELARDLLEVIADWTD